MTDLEIEPAVGLTAAVAYSRDQRSRLDPGTDRVIQSLIVTIEAHVAVTVIDNHQQTIARHPIRKGDATARNRTHFSAHARAD
jgi:hypothetical protein